MINQPEKATSCASHAKFSTFRVRFGMLHMPVLLNHEPIGHQTPVLESCEDT